MPSSTRRATGSFPKPRARRPLQPLGNRLGLQEETEVVAPAGLAVRAGHVEAAEGVDADERARALAIDVEVARAEALFRLGDPHAVPAEVRAREAVLARVRELDGVVEIARLGDSQDGPEDLLAEDACGRLHVVKDGGLNEIAGAAVPDAAGPDLRLPPSDLDEIGHGLEPVSYTHLTLPTKR